MHDRQKGLSINRFPVRMCLRAPLGLQEAIEVAAAAQHTQPSEWARQALLRGLAQDGLTLLPNGQIGSTGADGRSGGAPDAGDPA
jgi:hypothetical protein